MPEDKDFKRVVRARMEQTGERYTQARSELRPPTQGAPRPADPAAASASPDNGPGSYATLGLTEADIRSYRSDMRGLNVEEIAGAWVLGLRAEHIAAYLAAMPTLDLSDMQSAWVLGVRAEHIAAYLAAMPTLDLDDMQSAWVMGMRAEHIAAYLAAMSTLDLDDMQGAWVMGMRAEHIAAYRSKATMPFDDMLRDWTETG